MKKRIRRNRVYIAGKVTGLSRITVYYNFEEEEKLLINSGYNILNPVKKCKSNWSYFRCMVVCIFYLIFYCNKISLLSNWQDSKGAKIEYKIAKFLNYDVINNKPCQ